MTRRPSPEAPKRVQMHRRKGGWRRDHPDAVIVARPTKWGNPWRMGSPGKLDACDCLMLLHVPLDAAQAVEWYDAWLYGYALHKDARPSNLTKTGRRLVWDDLSLRRKAIWDAMPTLRGRDLACWCPLDRPCHADVLLRLANREPTP